jgi:hypothetical protein
MWELRIAAIVLAGALAGCAEPENGLGPVLPASCAPGLQVACACQNGGQGVQRCNSNGRGFSDCQCPSSSGTPGGGGGGGGSGGGDPGGSSAGGADPGGGGAPNGGAPGGGGWAGVGGWAGGSFGPVGDYAGGVRIDEVAVYQAVKISIMKNGSTPTPNAPIVQGRPAVVRVFVSPMPGYQPRSLTALLELESSDPNVQSQTVSLQVAGASQDGSLDSTFNFTLPPEQMTGDLKLAISLHEPSGATIGSVDSGAVWPAQGKASLGAKASGPVHVTLVPFRYLADGSGRLPDTSPTQMQAYQAMMFAIYPTPKLELTVRAPVDYSSVVGPGWGWSEWLDTLCALRQQDGVDSKTYYYGAMAPEPSWQSYGSGIAGLGYVPDTTDDWGRCAVGLDFPGADEDGTIMAHEVGHTLGRPHAPCGVAGEPFPYSNASIGVWGLSLVSGTLKDPGSFHDVMSYCDPQWISDVNYGKLFQRIQWVNQNAFVVASTPKAYRKLLVDVDGSVSWGQNVTLSHEASGEQRRVELLAADGSTLASIDAHFSRFSEDPAGALFVPELDPAVAAIRVDGLPVVFVPAE